MMLLLKPPEEIITYTNSMWEEAMQIKYSLQKLAWFMRGGIQYTDIMNMSRLEIINLNKIIDENLELTKETKLPFI